VAKSQGGSCTGCLQIPCALTAVAVGYHLTGIGSRLHLDGSALAEIYLGQITSWNDLAAGDSSAMTALLESRDSTTPPSRGSSPERGRPPSTPLWAGDRPRVGDD
jgi:ABC-type phosphate transport system substrate-binding protein